MLQFNKWQVGGVALLIAMAALFAFPNFISPERAETLPGFVPKTRVNLGLDLQGGSYLLLRVETTEVIDNRMTGLRRELQREMRPRGERVRIPLASLPTYDPATRTVSLSVRNDGQVEDAADRIRDVTRPSGATLGLGIRPYAVTVDGATVNVRMTEEAQAFYGSEAVRDSIEVVRRRIDPVGNKEVLIQPQGADRIIVQAPGDNDPESLKALINRTGQLNFHHVDRSISA
ncbi:MAG: hypothetical protein AAF742_08800 [Pseudomonadota bacterium]